MVTFTLFFSSRNRRACRVVIVDAGAVLHLFQLDHVLLLLRDPRLLRHFELVLPVVHDADDGRASSGGHFDEIQALVFRHPERGVDFEDA